MTMRALIRASAAAVVLSGMLAACAGPAVAPDGPRAIEMAAGAVFTDARGMTLYVYDKDAPGVSHCTGVCAVLWPPAEAGAPAQPADGFSLITRGDGSRQWAYQGKPLYGYTGDSKPGEVTGDGVGGVWHAARP